MNSDLEIYGGEDVSQPLVNQTGQVNGADPDRPGDVRTVHVIVNPAAGQDRPFLKEMNTIFKDAGVDYDIFVTQKQGDARRLAMESVAAGVDVVAAYGGDGTTIETASGLVGSGVPLGILPGGTGNMTARALGVPTDLAEALTLITSGQGKRRSVTLGQINDHHFFQLIGIGMEAKMVEGADRNAKDRLGNLAYILSALQALAEPQVSRYHLRIDDQEEIVVEGVTCLVSIIENSGMPALVDALGCPPETHHLDVIILQKADLGTFMNMLGTVAGITPNSENVQRWHVQKAHIRADPPQPVQSDGELLGSISVDVRVLPDAIQVIVPPDEITPQP